MNELLRDCEDKHPRDPLVKKIVVLLAPRSDKAIFDDAMRRLEREWGAPQRLSETIPFTWTNYYEEISPQLDRYFISYPGLYPFSKLPEWKIASCRIEKETGPSRRVNLDPGTIDGVRLVLASTKGQAHRVYLRDGIFAEVTLCRRKGRWESFFYTFPDFKSGAYNDWLDLVRADWKREHYEGNVCAAYRR